MSFEQHLIERNVILETSEACAGIKKGLVAVSDADGNCASDDLNTRGIPGQLEEVEAYVMHCKDTFTNTAGVKDRCVLFCGSVEASDPEHIPARSAQ